MQNIHIRAFKSEDHTQLHRLLELNIPQYFAETELEDFKEYLNNEVEDYFIVEIDQEIVGSGGINYDKENNIAKISWDVIHPVFQGRGIGKMLLQYRIDHIKKYNPDLKITVRTSQIVYKFYEKNGFKLIAKHKDFWAEGYDMYKMIYEQN